MAVFEVARLGALTRLRRRNGCTPQRVEPPRVGAKRSLVLGQRLGGRPSSTSRSPSSSRAGSSSPGVTGCLPTRSWRSAARRSEIDRLVVLVPRRARARPRRPAASTRPAAPSRRGRRSGSPRAARWIRRERVDRALGRLPASPEARGADRAREVRRRLARRESDPRSSVACGDCERGRFLPRPPLERVARRDRGQRVAGRRTPESNDGARRRASITCLGLDRSARSAGRRTRDSRARAARPAGPRPGASSPRSRWPTPRSRGWSGSTPATDPSRVKMCDGMCCACGEAGAISA